MDYNGVPVTGQSHQVEHLNTGVRAKDFLKNMERLMIKIKQGRQVLIRLGLLSLLLCVHACNDNENKDREDYKYEYGLEWEHGKNLFYTNCSQCHLPRNKDEIFNNYLSNHEKQSESYRLERFKNVLADSNHVGKNIGNEQFNKDQIKQLLEYLESPQQKKVIN